MTAPDKNVVAKPLHERIAEHAKFRGGNVRAWLKEKDDLLREAAADLSRMRTALDEIASCRGQTMVDFPFRSKRYDEGAHDAFNQCAAIAERALTAGSGNE